MSANLLVDLGNTVQQDYSVPPTLSVALTPASGTIVGNIVDMLHSDTYCNLHVQAGGASGILRVAVQTSDSTTSGNFADPTSGMVPGQFPGAFQSGGILICNSGLWASGALPVGPEVDNAPLFCSGGMQAQGFVRNGRYVRAIVLSGSFPAPVAVAFLSQMKTTGSGGGFTYSPGSGTVNV